MQQNIIIPPMFVQELRNYHKISQRNIPVLFLLWINI